MCKYLIFILVHNIYVENANKLRILDLSLQKKEMFTSKELRVFCIVTIVASLLFAIIMAYVGMYKLIAVSIITIIAMVILLVVDYLTEGPTTKNTKQSAK